LYRRRKEQSVTNMLKNQFKWLGRSVAFLLEEAYDRLING